MTYRPPRMSFGVFLAPFHPTGDNPTLAIERDLQLLEHLDALGFEEAWIGEHHSAGWEIIADPTLIIAAAAQRTKRIRLGTGVLSLPYHHPLMVADRMVQLDHMTRGRAMLGVGPGALASDAYMLGIDPVTQRGRMAEALEAIIALLRAEAPVTMKTDWFELNEARLQLASYTHPHLPVSVAHTFSPAGPVAAGQFGIGMLSVASFAAGGLIALPEAWAWAEEAAAKHGQTVDRKDWRVVIPFHLAPTREQAMDEVRAGVLAHNVDYFTKTLGRPTAPGEDEVEAMVARGGAIIGTPQDAVEAIERIIEISGGFGGFLGLAHEWAPREATWRSFEMWARYVAPHFQGQIAPIEASRDWVAQAGDQLGTRGAATRKAFEDAGKALPQGKEHEMERGRT